MSKKYYYDDVNVHWVGRIRNHFLVLVLLILIVTGAFHIFKPLPAGIGMEGTSFRVPASSITFLRDLSYVTEEGERRSEQEIFDEVFRMINEAREYVLIDMFLYNDFQGKEKEIHRPLSRELTNALINKKVAEPNVEIVVITDPINALYGGYVSKQLKQLRANDVDVIVTNLHPLRDSNPIYSSIWRTFFAWFGNGTEGGLLPNPLNADGEKVTIRSYLTLFNFKANHRKLVIADALVSGEKKIVTLITSGNPHDASSMHSNVAVKIEDALWRDVIVSEQATAILSDASVPIPTIQGITDRTGKVNATLLTEGKIKSKLIELIDDTNNGDTIDMVMFYLAEREVIEALVRASKNGVSIRLVLDPNKDAFGHKKNGVPNRPVAKEFRKRSSENIDIRWCDTHGEQCHSKLILIKNNDSFHMMLGSANLTRRNISDYNLETNVLISSQLQIKAIEDAYSYFDMVWNNEGGRILSIDYEAYRDESVYKSVLYHIMERTGLSSF